MAPDDDAALEAKQQMLADRLDRFEHAPVDCGRQARRRLRCMRLRREPVADEGRQALRHQVQRVALGQG